MKGSELFIIALAERIAPEEVDTAPAILGVIERNGKDWRAAIEKNKAVIGGWTGIAELPTVMPDVVIALQHSWHTLELVLELSVVGIHLSELRKWTAEWLDRKKASHPSDQQDVLLNALNTLAEEIRKRGMAPETANVLAAGALEVVASNPNAPDFAKSISA